MLKRQDRRGHIEAAIWVGIGLVGPIAGDDNRPSLGSSQREYVSLFKFSRFQDRKLMSL